MRCGPGSASALLQRGGQLLGGRRLDRGHAHAAARAATQSSVGEPRSVSGAMTGPGSSMPARCISIDEDLVAAVRDDDRRDVEALAGLRPQRLQRVHRAAVRLQREHRPVRAGDGRAGRRRWPCPIAPPVSASSVWRGAPGEAAQYGPPELMPSSTMIAPSGCAAASAAPSDVGVSGPGSGAGGGGAGSGSGPSATPRCSARRSSASTPSWPGALSSTTGGPAA